MKGRLSTQAWHARCIHLLHSIVAFAEKAGEMKEHGVLLLGDDHDSMAPIEACSFHDALN